MRAGVVQRHHRLRPPAVDDLADPLMDLVQRRLPRDALELPGSLRPDAAQRMKQALRSVHEVAHLPGDLVADDPGRVRQRIGAAHLDDAAAVIDHDTQAAGVGTIEGADARAHIDRHGDLLPASAQAPKHLPPPSNRRTWTLNPRTARSVEPVFVSGAGQFLYAMFVQRYRPRHARVPMYSQKVIN